MKNLVAFVAACVAIAGCHKHLAVPPAPADVQPSGPVLSVQAYSGKINEIDDETSKLMSVDKKALQDAQATADQGKQMDLLLGAYVHMLKVIEGQLLSYEAVNPPPELAKAHAVLVNTDKELGKVIREAIPALENKDESKLEDLTTKMQELRDERAKKLAAEIDAAGYMIDENTQIRKKG